MNARMHSRTEAMNAGPAWYQWGVPGVVATDCLSKRFCLTRECLRSVHMARCPWCNPLSTQG
eukprot:5552372-Alexandrium_andersonii.AAC.1